MSSAPSNSSDPPRLTAKQKAKGRLVQRRRVDSEEEHPEDAAAVDDDHHRRQIPKPLLVEANKQADGLLAHQLHAQEREYLDEIKELSKLVKERQKLRQRLEAGEADDNDRIQAADVVHGVTPDKADVPDESMHSSEHSTVPEGMEEVEEEAKEVEEEVKKAGGKRGRKTDVAEERPRKKLKLEEIEWEERKPACDNFVTKGTKCLRARNKKQDACKNCAAGHIKCPALPENAARPPTVKKHRVEQASRAKSEGRTKPEVKKSKAKAGTRAPAATGGPDVTPTSAAHSLELRRVRARVSQLESLCDFMAERFCNQWESDIGGVVPNEIVEYLQNRGKMDMDEVKGDDEKEKTTKKKEMDEWRKNVSPGQPEEDEGMDEDGGEQVPAPAPTRPPTPGPSCQATTPRTPRTPRNRGGTRAPTSGRSRKSGISVSTFAGPYLMLNKYTALYQMPPEEPEVKQEPDDAQKALNALAMEHSLARKTEKETEKKKKEELRKLMTEKAEAEKRKAEEQEREKELEEKIQALQVSMEEVKAKPEEQVVPPAEVPEGFTRMVEKGKVVLVLMDSDDEKDGEAEETEETEEADVAGEAGGNEEEPDVGGEQSQADS
ncbi:hypothetical protein R3P38DRAFT_3172712 [Favolaschia claudopus]|uniref:Zn(2)-C6 fungal-type domain-containing protein n=1 Tax=Favolaschia claudopus TaxID=2862362 RepID=A0AAW0DMU7_9AGAR